MRILAIDTTTEACSAALLAGERLYARAEEPGRGAAERILTMVDEVLAEAGTTLGAVDAIAACIGPGGFTGVRICVATAQGLAFGAGIPVVPVTSLEALAASAARGQAANVLACLDARMNELYWSCFGVDAAGAVVELQSPRVSAAADVALPPVASPGRPWRGIGRGLAASPELAGRLGLAVADGDERALPDARWIARLAAARLGQPGAAVDPAALNPLYVRDTVARTEAERSR